MPQSRYDRIVNVLENFSTDDLANLVMCVNAWDGALDHMDWRPMDMWEIMDYIGRDRNTLQNVLESAADGEFNPRDDYFRYYGGGLESTDDPDFDIHDIADWIDERISYGDNLAGIIGDCLADCFVECYEPDYDPYPFGDEDITEEDCMTEDEIVETLIVWFSDRAFTGELKRYPTPAQLPLLARALASKTKLVDPADVIEQLRAQNYESYFTAESSEG